MSRLEIACLVFNWKKATWQDLSRELEAPIEELKAYSDVDFLEIICYYANNVGVLQ